MKVEKGFSLVIMRVSCSVSELLASVDGPLKDDLISVVEDNYSSPSPLVRPPSSWARAVDSCLLWGAVEVAPLRLWHHTGSLHCG